MITTDFKQIFSISENELNTIDENIFDLLKFWKSEKDIININTSGSTGNPKTITLTRKALINSAETTLKYFKLKNNSSFHCCLPTKYIGGKMMLNIANTKKYKKIEKETIRISSEMGFKHIDTIYLILSSVSGNGEKLEPIFVFEK